MFFMRVVIYIVLLKCKQIVERIKGVINSDMA